MTQAQTIRVGSGRTRVLLIHGSGSAAKPFSRLGERLVAEVTDSYAVAVTLAGYGSEGSDPHLSRIEQHLNVLDPGQDEDALEDDREIIRRFAVDRDNERGVSQFIETWNQAPWQDLPETLRLNLVNMAPLIYREASAVSSDRTSLTDYRSLTQPILLLAGTDSLQRQQ